VPLPCARAQLPKGIGAWNNRVPDQGFLICWIRGIRVYEGSQHKYCQLTEANTSSTHASSQRKKCIIHFCILLQSKRPPPKRYTSPSAVVIVRPARPLGPRWLAERFLHVHVLTLKSHVSANSGFRRVPKLKDTFY